MSFASSRRHLLRAFLSLAAILSVASCTTKPTVLPGEPIDPTGVLPSGEAYYILVRPAEHSELMWEILTPYVETEGKGLQSVLSRTDEGVLSGRFKDPRKDSILSQPALPVFSAVTYGHYPAVLLRTALKKEKQWENLSQHVYRGPYGLLADTTYKNTLLVTSKEERMPLLQFPMESGKREAALPASLAQWWVSGQPALVVYIPELAGLPLPTGLPEIPEGSSLDLSLIGIEEGGGDSPGEYSLDLQIVFPDKRSAKLWSLGVRVYLATRLGLSLSHEERSVLQSLDLSVSDRIFRLKGWTMSAPGWGQFLSSFRD